MRETLVQVQATFLLYLFLALENVTYGSFWIGRFRFYCITYKVEVGLIVVDKISRSSMLIYAFFYFSTLMVFLLIIFHNGVGYYLCAYGAVFV